MRPAFLRGVPGTPAPSSALFFHLSANGESNHPGATTFTVMPNDAEVERETLRHADEAGLRRAVRGEACARPFPENRAGEDQSPALPHRTGRGAGAEECTGQVHVEDLTPDRRIGFERPGQDRRDPRVADPDVDATPLGHRAIGDRVVELAVGHVAREREDGPGSASATALMSTSVRATSATRAPPCENACASNRPSPGSRR